MNVRELIEELKRFDPELPVCGESETHAWDITPEELIIYHGVGSISGGFFHERALILGYTHRLGPFDQ